QSLADSLNSRRVKALALHGDLEQKDRDRVLVQFSNKSVGILIATDVAARGIDVKNLDVVINVDLARDSQVHVHRIGRTGRAGLEGVALSLVAPNDLGKLNRLEDTLQKSITLEALPQAALDELPVAQMVTINIDGGKKDKLRPGDILGALTKDVGIAGSLIGKIDIFDFVTYVAVDKTVAN